MKRLLSYLFIFIFISLVYVPVNATSDYYKDIRISFNSTGCPKENGKNITIQLFKDGEAEGDPVILNSSNNYTHTYEHLYIFGPQSPVEIKYDVKVLENGKYRLLSPKHQSHQTKPIKKWVQILPEYIKEGHTYVLTTDNWNYESNGFSKVIYLRGDITAKGAQVLPEYNIINGMQSYYYIDGDPIENTKWVASKVPKTDPEYQQYKDYWMFTNEEDPPKKLTLTGYLQNESINYIFKRSGRSGLISSTEYNSNKMKLTYVDGSKGRFYISAATAFPDVENRTQYITLSGQNQYQSGDNMDRGAQFKAFEYVDTEVEIGETVDIEESMCPKDEITLDTNSDYKRNITVKFDCKGCESKKESGIVLQLFADGKKVEDGKITLNNKNGFDYVYKDLPIFWDGTSNEINYEVKALIKGKYYAIAAKNIKYKKQNINKWLQVLPNDIKADHTYVLVAENPSYGPNSQGRYVYLRGDISSKTAGVEKEYNVINGNKLYYSLKGEPLPNTKWIASKVPTDDPDYDAYKDYLMFTNEENPPKKLTLTAYLRDGYVDWIFKRSGNSGWVNNAELNTNRVTLTSTGENIGKFYISTYSLLNEPYNTMQYISLNGDNNFYAGSDIQEAAQFIAYEYLEKEITVESEMLIEASLCEVLSYPDLINPDTKRSLIIVLCFLALSSVGSYLIIKRNKKINI